MLHQARFLDMLERQTQTVYVNFYIALLLLHKNIICANQILVTPSLVNFATKFAKYKCTNDAPYFQ